MDSTADHNLLSVNEYIGVGAHRGEDTRICLTPGRAGGTDRNARN
jgi:hypothetical protein